MNNDAVFPKTVTLGDVSRSLDGLTKRELFAAVAMHSISESWDVPPSEVAERAVALADALIEKLADG